MVVVELREQLLDREKELDEWDNTLIWSVTLLTIELE
jgi:hypothetical protein